jgi:hypothetical protein
VNREITDHVDSVRRPGLGPCGATATDVRIRRRGGSGVLRGAGQSSSTETAAVIASSAAGLIDDQERIPAVFTGPPSGAG